MKLLERCYYLSLRISIIATQLIASFFCAFPWLIIRTRKRKNLLMLPYYPKDNAGAIVRFQNYLSYFQKDNLTFDITYIGTHDELFPLMVNDLDNSNSYKKYRKILWKRFFWVLKAKNYVAIYLQRGAFPLYPDLDKCFLGKLMFKLNDNITIDYYDADFLINETLVKSSVKFSHKISVVNEFLENYFKKLNNNVFIHPIALDKNLYKQKENYKINDCAKIVWCGTKGNFDNLKILDNVFINLSKKFKIKVIIISHEKYHIRNVDVENVNFKLEEFTETLKNCDIAVYPIKYIDDFAKGGMAMKALEYSATALPTVATPVGLSPFFEENHDVLIANNEDEWFNHLSKLILDENLRKSLGENIYHKFLTYHSLEDSYSQLKNIIFSRS